MPPRKLIGRGRDTVMDRGIKIPEENLPSWLTEIAHNAKLAVEVALAVNPFAQAAATSLAIVQSGLETANTVLTELNARVTSHISNVSNPHAVTKAQIGLSNVTNTTDANKPVSTAQQAALNLKSNTGHGHTFADITGQVSTAQLPPLAINETFPAASQVAMLALPAQRGDMAIRTDNGRTYVLSTDSPSTLADWKEVMAAGQVQSVNGKTGAITLAKTDISLGNVDNTSDVSKPVSTPQQTALNLKADKTLATNALDGLMAKADKAKLDRAVPDAYTNTLMWRDAWGRSQIAPPVGPNDVVNKGYSDSLVSVIGEYVATGSKENSAASGQEIGVLSLVPGGSSSGFPANVGAAGALTVTKDGIYAVTYQIRCFFDSGMTTTKSMTGRSFIDIIDDAGATTVRVPIATGESQSSATHTGLKLTNGGALHFAVYQTSGTTIYYKARLWVTKIG